MAKFKDFVTKSEGILARIIYIFKRTELWVFSVKSLNILVESEVEFNKSEFYIEFPRGVLATISVILGLVFLSWGSS